MIPTPVPFANGTASILMCADLENLSDYKKEMGKLYRALWDERREFSVKTTLTEAA